MWRLIRKVLSTTDFKKRKRTLSFQMFALVSYFPVSVYKVMVQPSSHVDIQNCVVADDVWFMTTRPSVHSSKYLHIIICLLGSVSCENYVCEIHERTSFPCRLSDEHERCF